MLMNPYQQATKSALIMLFSYPYYYVTIWALICGYFQRMGVGGLLRLLFETLLEKLRR